jgi:hypothetical protein
MLVIVWWTCLTSSSPSGMERAPGVRVEPRTSSGTPGAGETGDHRVARGLGALSGCQPAETVARAGSACLDANHLQTNHADFGGTGRT